MVFQPAGAGRVSGGERLAAITAFLDPRLVAAFACRRRCRRSD